MGVPELDIGEGKDRSHDCNDDPVPPLHFFFPVTGVAVKFGAGNVNFAAGVGLGVGLGTIDSAGAGVIVGDGMSRHADGGPISGT